MYLLMGWFVDGCCSTGLETVEWSGTAVDANTGSLVLTTKIEGLLAWGVGGVEGDAGGADSGGWESGVLNNSWLASSSGVTAFSDVSVAKIMHKLFCSYVVINDHLIPLFFLSELN